MTHQQINDNIITTTTTVNNDTTTTITPITTTTTTTTTTKSNNDLIVPGQKQDDNLTNMSLSNITITTELYIGCRIESDDGYIGTIRYEGKVDGFEGNWFGVEWDHPTRGKHRGTVKGKQYFQCQYPDSSGSFMKKEKIIKGFSLIHSLITKFTRKLENYDDLTVHSTKKNKMIQIEMVGMEQLREKQKNLNSHKGIDAHSLLISEIDCNILNQYLSSLLELNLSHNLLNNWNQVIDLVSQLPQLSKLILSENRLTFNQDDIEKYIKEKEIKQQSSLQSLVLFDMGGSVTWNHLVYLFENVFKNISTLGFGKNKLTDISQDLSSIAIFNNLKYLDLAYNNISSLNNIYSLGHLPNLEELNLNHNQIKTLKLENNDGNEISDDEKYNIFCNLKRIYLSNNLVNDWNEIDALDRFKSLIELSFRENPIIESLILPISETIKENEFSQDEQFQNVNTLKTNTNNYKDIISLKRLHIIPRISQLVKLNLTEITSTERKDAERFFLYEYYSNNNNNKTISNTKIRYLTSIHGER